MLGSLKPTYFHNSNIYEACIGYFGIHDIGLFLRDTGIFVFFILDIYGIFRNFGIWDIGIYLGYELN